MAFTLLLALLFVLVPFLFWRGSWFGQTLSEEETGRYLTQTEKPRKTQHALVQVAERIQRSDPTVKRWYPQVRALATHPAPEIRVMVAWVMGQDNQSAEFHGALLDLLHDPDPLVRRNAALSLVRFGDPSGKPELVRMLQPYPVTSPRAGAISLRLKEDDTVNPGTLLARVRTGEESPFELRSPLPGRVGRWLVRDGQSVAAGEAVVLLSPSEEQVWEALRALYLVGEVSDLPEVETYAGGVPGMPDKVRQQAVLTAEAIRRRAAQQLEKPGEKVLR